MFHEIAHQFLMALLYIFLEVLFSVSFIVALFAGAMSFVKLIYIIKTRIFGA